MSSAKYRNIDMIIKALKEKSTTILKFTKLDGITIECVLDTNKKASEGIKEITTICKQLKISPISTEENPDKSNVFALQFPELVPEYTDKEIEKMYKSNFKWLLDGVMKSDTKHKVTLELLINYRDLFLKQAITTYCNSNINLYKDNIANYLNNSEYRSKINKIYLLYVQEYINNGR